MTPPNLILRARIVAGGVGLFSLSCCLRAVRQTVGRYGRGGGCATGVPDQIRCATVRVLFPSCAGRRAAPRSRTVLCVWTVSLCLLRAAQACCTILSMRSA